MQQVQFHNEVIYQVPVVVVIDADAISVKQKPSHKSLKM